MSTSNTPVAVFTVCNIAYLAKALVLAESLSEYDGIRLKIYLVDRKVDLAIAPEYAELLWIEDAAVPDFLQLAFKYDITELGTSVKPFLSHRLLDVFDKVVYLDPDIMMYASIAPVLADLDRHPILLTPHYVRPHPNTVPDSDIAMMRFGSVNLGFYGVRQSEEANRFLEWLTDRCFRFCYFETQFGLSTDQKWVSIAPCFFPGLHISRNLGYNAAFWNTHERTISRDAGGQYVVNGADPLIYFHFSSFDEANPENLSKRPFMEKSKRRADLAELSMGYRARLQAMQSLAPPVKYAFDYMSDGAYVSPTLRRAYACVLDELPQGHDPFDATGPVGDFARRNHLLEKRGAPYAPAGYSDAASHQRAFGVIYFCMRIVLRVLGPNRFANFSRLLVHLSSYRQTRPLWKL